MKMSVAPPVSVGMPVYNGAKHIATALDSILSQTFGDFELIISDNASTDRTEEICRAYATRDSRIRYIRNPENLGASPNFNKVFEVSSGGKYFRWAAHDDLLTATCLEKHKEILDNGPASAVTSITRRRYISWEDGHLIGTAHDCVAGVSTESGYDSGQPIERMDRFDDIDFRKLLRMAGGWFPILAFGMHKTEALKKTHLLQPFPGADLVMTAELRFLGEFLCVPEELYFQRLHPAEGWTLRSNRKEEAAWFNPRSRGTLLPHRANLYYEYSKSILSSPISLGRKLSLYGNIVGRFGDAASRKVRKLFGGSTVAAAESRRFDADSEAIEEATQSGIV
jgi:glycosyltransferase involved in cell wall biosynthesis